MPLFRRHELFAAPRSLLPGRETAWLWLFLFAVSQTPARGQEPASGALHGIVIRADGSPSAAATIVLRNLQTGAAEAFQTLRDGSFLLAGLSPGEYRLRLAGPHAQADPPGSLIVIEPGETAEIQVEAGRSALRAPKIERQHAAEGEPDENSDGLPSVHGLETNQTGSSLDGASSTQSFGGVPAGTGTDDGTDPDDDADTAERTTGPQHGLGRGRRAGLSYAFAQGAVREFRIGAETYGAQVGKAGGVLTSTSLSGSDRVHGSAFFDLRSSALAATNPLAIATSYTDGVITSEIVKPHDLRERFGLTFGGPLPRAPALRLFYAFDQQRRGFPAFSTPADPSFYNLTATQRALLATRGVSPAAINAQLNSISSLTGLVPRRSDQTIHFGRVDWVAGPHFGLGVQYNRVRWNAPAGLLDAPTVARGRASVGTSLGSVDQAMLRIAATPSLKTCAEFRLAYTRDLQYELPQTPLPQEPAIAPGGLVPEVNIGPNGLLLGTPASLSQRASPNETRLEAGATITFVRGHHLMEAGGSFAAVKDDVATLANAAGTFRYDSGVTHGKAGGLVDFITDAAFNVNAYPNGGCPTISAAAHLFCFRSYTQSFGEERLAFKTDDWSGFVEDTWRPHPRLDLHAGLRYEYTLLPLPQRPNIALDTLFGDRGATSIFPEDRNNFGPRLSASFEPLGRGRGVLRVGYGVFFGRLPGATIKAALADTGQISSTTRIRIGPSAVIGCPQVPAQGFGYPCSFTAQPGGVVLQTTSAVVFDRHFRLPVVQQGSVTFERSVLRRTSFSVALVTNSDRQLPGSTDLNIMPSTEKELVQLHGGNGSTGVRDGETFLVPRYTTRVTPSFGPVTDIVSHANASYNGLVLRLTSRPLPAILIDTQYTWSKAIDFGQSSSATPRTNGQFDPFADGYDKGLSSLNYPQSLHWTAVWTPSTEGAGWRVRACSGWSLSAISTARSGRPYSYDLSGGASLPGGHESVNGSGGALYLPTIGRNTLRLPPNVKTDLRLSRGFSLKQKIHGQVAVEASNVLNHRSISSVNQRAYLVGAATSGVIPIVYQDAAAIAAEGLNTTPFGTPTASGSSLNRERQVELKLRLFF